MKYLLIAVAVLLVGWLAWTRLPGLRTQVSTKLDEVGGWTEEARRADPVGFLTFAEEKLQRDLETFRTSREALAETKTSAEAEGQRNAGLLRVADELAAEFRAAFQAAEASGAWPTSLRGASYTREQLVEQVDSVLRERVTYARVTDIYAEVVASADEQRKKLRDRIQSTEAALVELKAKKELVRVDALTAETDALLGQVEALLTGNQSALGALDEPRSVEELLKASSGAPAPDERQQALDFLTQER
ncbi:MAG: hypothetical protein H6828_09300 [Planctomycetes bacterium]|nr:hypothetical protein [Planctomycetota bacterium]